MAYLSICFKRGSSLSGLLSVVSLRSSYGSFVVNVLFVLLLSSAPQNGVKVLVVGTVLSCIGRYMG